MIISHIVAASENNVIGKDNDLPWHIPEDLKFFKEKTKNHAVIMGRKTYESVGKPLPKRLNVIVTRQKDYHPEGTVVVSSIEEAIEHCRHVTDAWGEEVFIAGGGEIFRQSMPMTDIIYLTRIHKQVEGDITYPDVNPLEFEEVERRERQAPVPFTFLTYTRRK